MNPPSDRFCGFPAARPRRRRSLLLLAGAAVAVGAWGCGEARDADDPEVSVVEGEVAPGEGTPAGVLAVAEALRDRLEAGLTGSAPPTAAGRRAMAADALTGFYVSRLYDPAWLQGAQLTSSARELVEALRQADLEGLNPVNYHLAALDSLLALVGPGEGEEELRRRADVELLLTDAFLSFGSHLLRGGVNPESREPTWLEGDGAEAELVALLEEVLNGGDVAGTLERLGPQEEMYHGLRDALGRYRAMAEAGGWDPVPPGPVLELGSEGPRVAALRARLAATGDLAPDPREASADPELFDEALDRAVRSFQARHGLETDGRVGPASLRHLNVPVEERISQLEVNLERWRWMPQDLGERYFLVNIAAFQVEVWEDGVRERRFRGIVGRPFRQTPVFSETMSYLVLAPHWHVPPGIAANDQLPRIRENPGYLASQRMVLLEQATNRAVDPHSVDWTGMTGAEFNRRFRIRQDPGPHNALGDVKFMFPNRFNVYLHDTPGRELFDRAARDFSSGCIRVEGALELAAYLLREDPAWNLDRIQQVVRAGREQYVTLPTPYQVHLQYWTAWLEEDGQVHFREDIYNRDPAIRRALDQGPPVA